MDVDPAEAVDAAAVAFLRVEGVAGQALLGPREPIS
jgi:hypothetical protein